MHQLGPLTVKELRDKTKDPDIVYGRDSYGNLSEPDLSDFFPNGSDDPWRL
jgi:hypothetical protein